jgi:hypothetical protein
MLEHDRCGSDHSLFEGGELGVGHVAEPFRDRIGRKVQIHALCRPAVAAIQKRRRGSVARRVRVIVLRKFNQRIDGQTRKPAGLDHDVANKPAIYGSRLMGAYPGDGGDGGITGSFGCPPGFPLWPFLNQPLPVLLPRTSKAYLCHITSESIA